MGILQLPTATTGQVGLFPVTKKMVVTNTLDEVTTPGFLTPQNLQGFTVSPSDVLEVTYNADILTNAGPTTICSVSISFGIITLIPITGGNFTVTFGNTALTPPGNNVIGVNPAVGVTTSSIIVISPLVSTNFTDRMVGYTISVPGQFQINLNQVSLGSTSFSWVAYNPI